MTLPKLKSPPAPLPLLVVSLTVVLFPLTVLFASAIVPPIEKTPPPPLQQLFVTVAVLPSTWLLSSVIWPPSSYTPPPPAQQPELGTVAVLLGPIVVLTTLIGPPSSNIAPPPVQQLGPPLLVLLLLVNVEFEMFSRPARLKTAPPPLEELVVVTLSLVNVIRSRFSVPSAPPELRDPWMKIPAPPLLTPVVTLPAVIVMPEIETDGCVPLAAAGHAGAWMQKMRLELLPLTVVVDAPAPRIWRFLSIAIWPLVSVMGPTLAGITTVSPGLAVAIVSRSEPEPMSALFPTVRGAAEAELHKTSASTIVRSPAV